MSTPTTTIVMVGPRGVGKTSLLAAMYNELEKELLNCECNLFQDAGPTQTAILGQLDELKALANGPGLKIQTGEGIVGTAQERRYTFHLDVGAGGGPDATLEFVDLPGGWYTGTGNYGIPKQVLSESHVSFLAVDATALMESPSTSGGFGKYHERINAPGAICQAYKRATFPDGHVVILALIRAETYVKAGQVDALQRKTQEAYAEMAKILKLKGITIRACYVQTVGCLYFNAFTERDGMVESHFRRDPTVGYAPSRCAIPLRIAAERALKMAMDDALCKMMAEDKWWARILLWLGRETALGKARQKYAKVYSAFKSIAEKINKDDYTEIRP